MRTTLLLIGFSWFGLGFSLAADLSWHETEAREGDGIYSLLRRYRLDQHACNFTKFYELNKMERNAHLKKGKKYVLPVQLFTYNGKTIRSTIGIDDWELAVRIQEYNKDMLSEGLRADAFKQSKVLWVPYHMLHCDELVPEPAEPDTDTPTPVADPDFDLISNPGNRVFPIFGPAYAKTPLASNKLAGRVYYLVSGHGGIDPGAIGKRGDNTLCEDEYAYDVTLRLCRLLVAHGATAYMIIRDGNDGIRNDMYLECDKDETVWGGAAIPAWQKPRLFQRSDIINQLYQSNQQAGVVHQQVIVIHVDSRSKGQQTDLFFYYQEGRPESKALADQLLATMRAKYQKYRRSGQYEGTVKARDLHMLREVLPTTVYIELGNIRNSFDQQRVVLESNRQALANWLYEGLLSAR